MIFRTIVPRRALIAALLFAAIGAPQIQAEEPVQFNRDVRPILSDRCFACHGPDSVKRQADLRLDNQQQALAERVEGATIVPGNAAASLLMQRIESTDAELRMPPADSGKQLTPEQIQTLRRWIEQGAAWEAHWSFIPPRRPAPPAVSRPEHVHNPIDNFILARLDKEGLQPSGPADKATLIRRVTLDLTGLPPTPEEVDAFLADASNDAYERVVDRLLASPHYGERMAVPWMDAARYADTNGYQNDGERFMWRWRDWVIESFNNNQPFDQFTVEQLAGDLLPSPTLDQRIATGFNRNHRGNAEGGIIPEEYLVEYVVDRVDTTSTVWLGLTLGCARCHDHKFDPVTQREFYQLFAFFHNVPERGKAVKFGNSPPWIKAPTRDQQARQAELETLAASAEERWTGAQADLDAAQAAWEASVDVRSLPAEPVRWAADYDGIATYALDGTMAGHGHDVPAAQGRQGDPIFRDGDDRAGRALDLDGTRYLDCGDVGKFAFMDRFSLSAWILPRDESAGVILSRMTDVPQGDGYHLRLEQGRLQLHLVKRWLDDALRVETADPLPVGGWRHVLATYDGTRVAAGVKLYIDGRSVPIRVLLDDLNQTFESKEPLRIGAGAGPDARFRGLIGEVRLYRRDLAAPEAELLANADPLESIVARPPVERSPEQARKLKAYFLENRAPALIAAVWRERNASRERLRQFLDGLPTTMVMEELPVPRESFVLVRGEYDKHGEPVRPGLPAALDAAGGTPPSNRLDLARWIVDPANPLTARVIVNRWWQMHFGKGLVRTTDDFGAQGDPPSHPDLLDWLAVELVESGWDVKAMQRLIVTSGAYRQSSAATAQAREADVENRLLARFPRVRLSAETIRDQALAASGLLVRTLGGPSVKPYQPAGLWKELTGADEYVPDRGENLYRRGMYTFWKRTIAPPGMLVFDAPGRETCWVRETRTNTPLQALTLLNDVTYVEAARMLAERAIQVAESPEQRLTQAFRLVLARHPAADELAVLQAGLDEHLKLYRADPAAAQAVLSVGDKPASKSLDAAELAAYTAIAAVILNLDEAITRP